MTANREKSLKINGSLAKKMPEAIEIEEVVLGSLMLDSSCIDLVIPQLTPKDFYLPKHSIIFSAIKSLYAERKPIDILAITDRLRHDKNIEKVGGAFGVTKMTNRIGSTANIEYHVKVLQEKKILREVIFSDNISTQSAYDNTDPLELLAQKQNFLNDLIGDSVSQNGRNTNDLFSELITHLEDLRENGDDAQGTPIDLLRLKRIIKTWGKQELILVAARPGMGKTAFTKTIMNDCRKAGKVCVFFSLEMSRLSLIIRLALDELGIKMNSNEYTLERLKTLDFSTYTQVLDRIQEIKESYVGENFLELLHIDDTPAIDIVTFRAKLARIAAKMKAHKEEGFEPEIGAVVVDYLQLMRGNTKGTRQEEIAEISRGLKAAAKEFNVPIVALSQLSRAVESRGGDRRPVLSDIRESGQIEQDCDKIIFLWRAGYYVDSSVFAPESGYKIRDNTLRDNEELSTDFDGNTEMSNAMNVIEAIVAKHRNGGTGTAYLRFEGASTRITDFSMTRIGSLETIGQRAADSGKVEEVFSRDEKDIIPF